MKQGNNLRSVDLQQEIDLLCDRFESELRAGDGPKIEDFLNDFEPPDSSNLLVHLLGIELELTAREDAPSIAEYVARFPSQESAVQQAFQEAGMAAGTGPSAERGTDPIDVSITETLDIETIDTGANGPAPKKSEKIPSQISRFKIRSVLGEGAFGRVYRAHDPKLNREVALKVPSRQSMSEQAVKRFFREGRAAANLRHANICPVYELGDEGDTPFIAMAYIEGDTLAARMKATPYSAEEAVRLTAKLATALEYAHSKGVVHRDLKPSNIMFDAEHGEPVIMDFGLAHFAEPGESLLTTAGMVMGTPTHMSPEQAKGANDQVNAVSDVYSLGVVFYQLLTHRLPFKGSIGEVLGNILHVEPEPPSAIRADIDPQLEAICLKAMAKEPAARYSSMQTFAVALDAWQGTGNSKPMAPRKSAATTTPPQNNNRQRALLAGFGLAVAATAVIGAILWGPSFGGKPDTAGAALAEGTQNSDANQTNATQQTSTESGETTSPTTGNIAQNAAAHVKRFEVLASRDDESFRLVDKLQTLLPGDAIRFSIELNSPAYVRLVWVDAKGVAQELYPQDPELGNRGDEPVSVIESPVQVDRGWPLDPVGDSEIVMLLVSQEPFSNTTMPAFDLGGEAEEFQQVTRYFATRTAKAEIEGSGPKVRGLGEQSRRINDPILQMLEHVRLRSDAVHAIRIPTFATPAASD